MPKIAEGYVENFKTLTRAFECGDAALLDVRRKSDGKSVVAIVAIQRDGDEYQMIPFAIMIEGDPYEMYEPPSVDGTTEYEETKD